MHDFIILGAGLAGSSLAGLLAKSGYDVVILDKGDCPNYHLPETTLLASHHEVFKQLNIVDQVKICLDNKMSAHFVNYEGTQKITVSHYFNDNDANYMKPYRVDRSALDQMILQKAIQYGANYKPGSDVQFINLDQGSYPSVIYKELGEVKRLEAKFLIDASGKSAIIASQFQLKENIKQINNRFLIFSHFDHVVFRKTLEDKSVYISEIENGHAFVIPLRGNRYSVGISIASDSPINPKNFEAVFHKTISPITWIKNAVEAGVRKLPYLQGINQEFSCKKACSDKYLIVGEAAAFIDPHYCNGMAITLDMVLKAYATIKQMLPASDENKAVICNQYSEAIDALIQHNRQGFKRCLDKHSLKISSQSLADPHVPYGITYFLSMLSETGITKANNKSILTIMSKVSEAEGL